jgi:hypothetical protein
MFAGVGEKQSYGRGILIELRCRQMRSVRRLSWVMGSCAVLLAAGSVLRAQGPIPLLERARGAERVVVGRAATSTPMWQVNEHGDRLIVSVVRVAIEETLKGPAAASVDVEIEGGTIGDLTLHVSDQERFVPGERAVLYLRRTPRATFAPHLRGQSLLKVDAANRVQGSSLTVDDIRRELAAAKVR